VQNAFLVLQRILENAGIGAQNGEKYLLGDVVSAIKNEFGATPLLVCRHGSVEELRICFYKNFKVNMNAYFFSL
jgi:ribonuclease T2